MLITSTAQYWRGFAEGRGEAKKIRQGCRAGSKNGRNEARCAETRANAGENLDNPRPCRAAKRVPRAGEHRPDRRVEGAQRVLRRVLLNHLHGGGGRDWRRHQRLQRSATRSPGMAAPRIRRGAEGQPEGPQPCRAGCSWVPIAGRASVPLLLVPPSPSPSPPTGRAGREVYRRSRSPTPLSPHSMNACVFSRRTRAANVPA